MRIMKNSFYKLVDYMDVRIEKRREMELGMSVFEDTALKRGLSMLILNCNRRKHERSLLRAGDAFYVRFVASRAFSHLREAVASESAAHENRLRADELFKVRAGLTFFGKMRGMLKERGRVEGSWKTAVLADERVQLKRGFEMLADNRFKRKKSVKLNLIAKNFFELRLTGVTFGGWKVFWTVVTRHKRLVEKMYNAFQFASLSAIFDRWVEFHVMVKNARRLLPR